MGRPEKEKKEADIQTQCKTWRNKQFWEKHRSTRKTPSQLSTITKEAQQMEMLEELSIKLQSMKYERIQLRAILASYTKKNLNNRLNSFEMMRKDHERVMSDLQKLPLEISDSMNKCNQLIEENESYSYLHSLILRDLTQVKKHVHVLRLEKRKLWEEQIALQGTCEEVKKLFKEVQEKICEPCAEEHQVS
ncbi:1700049E17Rik2 [Phodopus roborovskii]|uniref:1700049E17Rik2 protein n=1 Tax=Phodopus roborovskii TaxID=109678 RepID=A0AAU9YYW6_PHORO|nr:1700049E17Rik2 [Phodopus roborovskii]